MRTDLGMVIFDYKYRGGFERHVNISYLLCSAGGDIQIRPSKFGGSFNQPNVPTVNVVVDMVAPQRRIAKIIGGEVDVKA